MGDAMAPHELAVTAVHHENDWCLLELQKQ